MRLRKIIISVSLIVGGMALVLLLVAALTMQALDESNGAIVSSGTERAYLLHVPQRAQAATPSRSLSACIPGRCGLRSR